MANIKKKCRVCGKEYEMCRTARVNTGSFRWQDVACSPECGSIYLAKVNESRTINHQSIKEEQYKSDEFIVDNSISDEELDEYFEIEE